MKNKRIEWIDSARGFAILLVVVGHVLGGYTGNYGVPQYQKIIDLIVDIIYYIYFPYAIILYDKWICFWIKEIQLVKK